MPVQTRSMIKAREAAKGPKNDAERIIEGNISRMISREWFSRNRAESIRRSMDLFEYILVPEVATYVDRQYDLKSDIRYRLEGIQSSDILDGYADTMKRVAERFFA
jgi:hypothetical protein